jgi:hypothetical protein
MRYHDLLVETMTLEAFLALAQRGQMRHARSPKEDLHDVVAGKMPAADFDITPGHPFSRAYEMGSFTKRLERAGLHVVDNYAGQVIAGRSADDVARLQNAKTAYQYGKAYGYSEADIAQFYLRRRGGHAEIAYREYLRDSNG